MASEGKPEILERISDIKSLIANFRVQIEDVVAKQKSKEGEKDINGHLHSQIARVLQMRKNNLAVQKLADELKQDANRHKEGVDEKNIHLENLLYQKNHISQEIKACNDYKTPELSKIHLIDLEAYQGQVADEMQDDLDEHQIFMNRLENENRVRKELKQNLGELTAKCKELQQKNEELRKKLKGLPKNLSDLEASTKPLQDFFKNPLSEKVDILRKAQGLPAPLYNIFCKFANVKEFEIDKKIKVEIEGTGEDLKSAFAKLPPESKMSVSLLKYARGKRKPELTAEELEKPKSQTKKKKRKMDPDEVNTENEEFPYYVKVTISEPKRSLETFKVVQARGPELENPYPIVLRFKMVPTLDIVVVEMDSTSKNLPQRELMANLFPNDHGFFNPIPEEKKGLHQKYISKIFKSVQYIAGFPRFGSVAFKDLLKFEQKVQEVEKSVETDVIEFDEDLYANLSENCTAESFVNLLRSRVASRILLKCQLSSLKSSSGIHSEINQVIKKHAHFKMVKERCTITLFQQIKRKDFDEIAYIPPWGTSEQDRNEYIGALQDKDMANYYMISLKREKYTIKAGFEVGYDYPQVPSIFRLKLEQTQEGRELRSIPEHLKAKMDPNALAQLEKYESLNLGFSNVLRSMEEELNLYYMEYVPKAKLDFLLSYQIKKLQVCFDLFYETNLGNPTILYDFPMKGKDQKRPFAFSETSFQFYQRE